MVRPEIIIIAAIAEKNRVIGKEGKLPWYISGDLKRFKHLTIGYPVLMGRKTFESIVERLGKPLPERRSIVLTSKSFADYPDVETYTSIESALAEIKSEEKIFVIGGERVFKETLEMADTLELTIVEGEYEGDAFFPEYEEIITVQFQMLNKEAKDGYRFESYKRK